MLNLGWRYEIEFNENLVEIALLSLEPCNLTGRVYLLVCFVAISLGGCRRGR